MKEQLKTSKKFYQEINDRISESVKAIGSPAGLMAAMKAAVDMYLADGIEPPSDSDVYVRMAFAILKPEIDKAVARSTNARERARRAKESMPAKRRESGKETSVKPTVVSGEEPEEAPVEIKRNRRERRRMERLHKRDLRRLEKLNRLSETRIGD